MKLFKSFTIENATVHFHNYFSKTLKKLKNVSRIQVLVHSEKLGLSYAFPSNVQQEPYHIASIGKLFTATLIFILIERGHLSLKDPISKFLPQSLLRNLFVFNGNDYSSDVTLAHLLGHTSGVADYFEDPVTQGISFLEDVLTHSDTLWTPDMLLDFSRNNQASLGIPGTLYHYSDTGYILLGKIIENVTQKSFHTNLHDEFFNPLQMNNSYLMFYSEPHIRPIPPIQEIWINNVETSQFKSLSCDWSGGGIVSTTQDLLKFHMALRAGKLIQASTLKKMAHFNNKFRAGIYYGLGMMELHFEDFFFMLKGLPRVTGHIGVLATHMFYDADSDTHIIMNFGSTSNMTKSFHALIEILNTLKKIK